MKSLRYYRYMLRFLNISLSITLCGLCACSELILHGLDEVQANRVLVALFDAGIKAEKQQTSGKWDIQVDENDVTNALRVLEKNRLLKRDLSRVGMKSSSLIKSKEERKLFLEQQLAWSIEHTLEAIPNVLEARVHLCMQIQDQMPYRKKSKEQTASVLLVYAEGALVDELQVKEIIAGASGIAPNAIKVILSERKNIRVINKEDTSVSEISANTRNSKKQGYLERIKIVVGVLLLVLGISVFMHKRPNLTIPQQKKSSEIQFSEEDKLLASNIVAGRAPLSSTDLEIGEIEL